MADMVQQPGPAGVPAIQGYVPGGWRVSGEIHRGGVLVMPRGARGWASDFATLREADFAAVAADEVEVLLLGTGATMRRPAADLLAALRARRLPVDYMDSKAAARTYNVLAAEGRRVAAALLPV